MRVLVTGGAGYLGSRVSACLLEAGMDVVVVDKLVFGGEGLLPLIDHPRFRLIVEDVRNEDALRAAIRSVDAIVHLAALVGEPACQVDPDATRSINVGATTLVAHLAKKASTERLVFVSTCSNYGVAAPDVLADEDAPLRPLSLYAETKVFGEQTVLEIADGGPAVCVLRLGTVCGLSTRMRFGLLVNDMARQAASGKPISIFSPEAWRPFLHISDAAAVIRHCLTAPSEALRRQVFNVVCENYQKRQLAELVRKHFPHANVTTKKAEIDPRDYRVNAERISRKLNFRPKHTVEDAFLEIARAVSDGLFSDPYRPIYEALPDAKSLSEKEYHH